MNHPSNRHAPRSSSTLVAEIRALERKPHRDEAHSLLQRLVKQVEPLMRKYRWTVGAVHEFFPGNPSLLGVNQNWGQVIRIRLRPKHDERTFLPYDDLLGTMLHELVHNVHSAHDAKFYKLLDTITDECERLLVSGYLAFTGHGQRLGGSITLTSTATSAALRAAEARRRVHSVMLPTGGRRLGGGVGGSSGGEELHALERVCSARELAVVAAMRRAQDAVWCGSSESESPVVAGDAAASASSSRSTASGLTPSSRSTSGSSTASSSTSLPAAAPRQQPEIIVISDDSDSDVLVPTATSAWTCSQCTFLNEAKTTTTVTLQVNCAMCTLPRPR